MSDRSNGKPEFGLVLSQFSSRFDHVTADALLAEREGLDSVWLVDHLLGVARDDAPIFEGWTALSFIAGATDRIRLGHLVNSVSYRNVGLLAKMAATLDHASNGRLELGLGAGWFEREYVAFGYEFPSAADRKEAFEEVLDALDLLFSGGPASYDGRFVQLRDAWCVPPPLQQPRPPVTVGTGGRLMRRVAGARADAWNCPAGLLGDIEGVRRPVIEAAGDRPIRTTVQIPVAIGRTDDEAEAALATARTHLAWMNEDLEGVGIVGRIDRAVDKVAEYRELGVDGFIATLPGSRRRPDFIAAYAELARTI